MKTDATTIGVVNRIGQQVIEINCHGRNHNEKRLQPMRSVPDFRYCRWHEKVQRYMYASA